MADFLDDLIGIQKEFKSITDDIASETADLRGATVSAEPVWTPSDYKVVPKGNSAMCVRCKNPEASCDLCQQVCPTDSIWFDDDGSIEIKPDCRKCGLCVAACPTDAIVSSMYAPKMLYDKICKAAEANEMVYVTCTRALGHVPEGGEIVVPCVGCISADVWYAILCEYGNVGIYLPRGICDKCRTTTGEEFYTDQISIGETWADEPVDLVTRERDLILEVDHQVERQAVREQLHEVARHDGGQGEPHHGKACPGGQGLDHAKQINELQKTLDRLCGAKSTTEKKRVLTNTRQLMLVALVDHPETAENILLDLPKATDACNGCGDCADACQTHAINIVDGKAEVLSTHCVSCALCYDVCPLGAIEFEECDGTRLIVDDPEAQKKIEEEEKAKQQREEAREKGKEYGKKALEFLEKQADMEEEGNA